MQLKFHTLDVFTDQRFGGNPLAVVHGADDLTPEEMQTVARELKLSETVFVMSPANPAHSAKIRIFTPECELPFAGHPTLGTAMLLAELRAPLLNGERDAIIALEQPIGIVRVGVRLRSGEAPFAEFDAPRLPVKAGTLASRDQLAEALGLLPREIGFENHTALRFSAGNTFAYIPVTGLEAIERAGINASLWRVIFPENEVDGVYLYTRRCVHKASSFHARMFAPQLGVPEDPATGSAAVGFAGVVNEFDDLPEGSHKRVIEQGYEIARPSRIVLTLIVEGDNLDTIRIGGNAVRVMEGTIEVRDTAAG